MRRATWKTAHVSVETSRRLACDCSLVQVLQDFDTETGDIVFTAPDGEPLPDYAPERPIDDDPYTWFEQEMDDSDIGPDTGVPHWYACDSIDWDMAVGALFPDPVQ